MDTLTWIKGLVGGVMIGLSAVWLMASLGRIAGISGILSGLIWERPKGDSAWRLAFLLGLVSGPLVIMLAGGGLGNVAGRAEAVVGVPAGGVGLMLVAGFLVGLGTGLGSGCTSGHGVCGLARLSPRSAAATLVFLGMAMLTVFVSRHLAGGGA